MPRDRPGGEEETERSQAEHAPLSAPADLAHSLSPVDLPDPPAPLPHGLRWTSLVIAWASLVLALLNAHAIRGWTYQLPPSAASARAVSAAETWYDAVGQAGLNRPVEAMHARWQAAREVRVQNEAAPAQASPEAEAN